MKAKHMGYKALSLLLTLVMMLSLLPAVSLAVDDSAAEDDGACAIDNEGTRYISCNEAWAAANNGKEITMLTDWVMDHQLEVEAGKTVVINMNGCKLDRNCTYIGLGWYDRATIYVHEGGKLTLTGKDLNGKQLTTGKLIYAWHEGENETTHTIPLYSDKIWSGGFICGGFNYSDGGGIHMEKNATVTLDNVAVDGNRGGGFSEHGYGGGIYMNGENGKLIMKNGAIIANNYADSDGGGVYIDASGCSIDMSDGSTIRNNYCQSEGGGIFCNASGFTLTMTGGSSIKENSSGEDGGGLYINYTGFTITSSDKTGAISNNGTAAEASGGGLYINSNIMSTNYGTIDSLIISNNSCSEEGGGIYLDQENIAITNCTISGNKATTDGGGIYINNDDCAISGCAITGNSAANGGGIYLENSDCSVTDTSITKNHTNAASGEGGGVFVDSYYNISLNGKVIIKNNYRADNTSNPDDLFLQSGTYTAYIISGPGTGSEIGLRTDASDDRKVGKDANFDEKLFFSDLGSFYMHADSDDEELWLIRKDNCSYPVYVNDVLQGYYNDTAVLTIDGTPTEGNLYFKGWTEKNGNEKFLDSTSKLVATVKPTASGDKHNMALYFTAVYGTEISDVTLTVAAPVAGEELATTGTLSWAGENDTVNYILVPVYWLIQNGDSAQTVSGTADYATKYSVAAKIAPDDATSRYFADSIKGKIAYTSQENPTEPTEIAVEKIYTDIEGYLYIYGKQTETEKANITSVEKVTVKVAEGSDADTLKSLVPETAVVTAEDGKKYVVNLDAEAELDLSKVLTDGKVTANGSFYVPLKPDADGTLKNSDELKLEVEVCLEKLEALKAPTASPESGTYAGEKDDSGKATLNVSLTAEEVATIYYSLNGGTETEYNAETGIALTAEAGTKETYVVQAYAGNAEGYSNSAKTAFTYTVDNPYTVTITKKTADGTEIGTAYTAKYYTGDAVTIPAPLVSGYTFKGWGEATGLDNPIYNVDNTITVASISGNITITALYSVPVTVVDSLNIELTAPKAGDALAETLTKVSADVSLTDDDGETRNYTRDMTAYLGENNAVVWYDGNGNVVTDVTAGYSTAYTARIVLPKDTTMTFSSLKQITVNDGAPTAVIIAGEGDEAGYYILNITFAATEAEESPTPVPSPTPSESPEPTTPVTPTPSESPEPTTPVTPSPSESPEPTTPVTPSPSESPKPTTPVTPTPSTSPTPTTPVTPEPTTPVTPEPTKPVTPDDGKCKQDSTCPIAKFSDSDPKAWYHDGVHYCLDEGLMKGVSDCEFAPNTAMTRAQLVTILWRMSGEKVVNYAMTFRDVSSDSWYTEAVRWAASEGIVEGYSAEKFGPNDAVTREQLATILWRYAKYKGMDVSSGEDTNIMDYNDVTNISPYAVPAMQWAVAEGIIKGIDNVTLAPKATATRAQVAVMVERFCK